MSARKPYPFLYSAELLIGWLRTKGEYGAAQQFTTTLNTIRNLPEITIDARWTP